MRVRSIINVSLLAAAVLLLLFGTVPLYDEGESLELMIPTRQQALEGRQTLKRRLDDLRATLGQITEEAERIENIVPAEPEIPEMVVSLESIANRNGMVLRDVQFGGTQRDPRFVNGAGIAGPPKEYRTMQLTLALSGSYEAMEGFLRDMERSLRLIDASSISLTGGNQEEGGSNAFEFSLQADAYYLR